MIVNGTLRMSSKSCTNSSEDKVIANVDRQMKSFVYFTNTENFLYTVLIINTSTLFKEFIHTIVFDELQNLNGSDPFMATSISVFFPSMEIYGFNNKSKFGD